MSVPSTPKNEPTLFAFDMSSSSIDPSVFQMSPKADFGQWPLFQEAQQPSRAPAPTCTPHHQRQRSMTTAGWNSSFHPYYPFGPSHRPRSLQTATPPTFNVFHSPPDSTSPLSSPGGYGVSTSFLRSPSEQIHVKADPDSDDALGIASTRKKATAEDTRVMRIESEQRRRDELREGFKRLREVLPHTSQRSSKAHVLDRSVAHIQSVEAANHYLVAQLQQATKEVNLLRMQNQELVQTMSRQRHALSPESC